MLWLEQSVRVANKGIPILQEEGLVEVAIHEIWEVAVGKDVVEGEEGVVAVVDFSRVGRKMQLDMDNTMAACLNIYSYVTLLFY